MADPISETTFGLVLGATWAALAALFGYLMKAVPRTGDVDRLDEEIKQLRAKVHKHATDIARLNLLAKDDD